MDRYSKFILTVIAVLLALNVSKPLLVPQEATADLSLRDVNVTHIAGQPIRYPLDIYIMGSVFADADRPRKLAMFRKSQ